MSTTQESCNTQCKHIMSCKWLNYLKCRNRNYKLFAQESKACKRADGFFSKAFFSQRKELIQTWTFCINRSWGNTEIDSRYTQKAQSIRKKIKWAVAGWIKNAATAQGTICAKRSHGKKMSLQLFYWEHEGLPIILLTILHTSRHSRCIMIK